MPLKAYDLDYGKCLLAPLSSKLIISFASGNQTKYEFGGTLERLKLNHVLIKDSKSGWYQNGIAGLPSRDELVKYIKRLTFYYNVTTLGLSSGSYGALLYGQLAEVDRIIAISPVTGAKAQDFPEEWRHRFTPSPGDPNIDDLRQYFKYGPIPYTIAFVTDGPDCQLDWLMATRLGIQDIRLVPGYEHGTLARGIRDNGILEEVLLK